MTAYKRKICLLGEFAVGKTSLVRRFVHNRFDDKYLSTIGVKVSRKSVVVPYESQITELTMLIWDLAGSEEFTHARTSYLRGIAGAVLVADLTRADTLERLNRYIEVVRQVNPQVQLVLAANKSDLTEQHELSPEHIHEFATHIDIPYCITSAKEGDEVDILFRQLANLLVAQLVSE